MIPAAPIIGIPVPRTKHNAIDIPNFERKITLMKVYKLAQPKLIINLPSIAQISEPALIENGNPVAAPAIMPPIIYVIHIQVMENAPSKVLEII